MVIHAANMLVGTHGSRVTFAGGVTVERVDIVTGDVVGVLTCDVDFHALHHDGYAYRTVQP